MKKENRWYNLKTARNSSPLYETKNKTFSSPSAKLRKPDTGLFMLSNILPSLLTVSKFLYNWFWTEISRTKGSYIRSTRPRVFYNKLLWGTFTKFREKHLQHQLSRWNFTKKGLHPSHFHVSFLKFFKHLQKHIQDPVKHAFFEYC